VSLHKPIYLDRTVVIASGGMLLLISAGCLGYSGRVTRVLGTVLFLFVIATNGFSLYRMYTYGEKEEWNRAAALVASRVRQGDLVLVDSGLSQIAFDLCFEGYETSTKSYGYPLDSEHWRNQAFTLDSRWWILDFVQFDGEAASSRLEALLSQSTRVWLVVNRPLGGARLQQVLETQSTDSPQIHQFNRIQVILYP
jgi:hypothetical protein